jgi:adenylate cyclase
MIGDAVNLSARLESLNKTLGTHILISQEVQQRLGGEFRTRLVGRFKVKGRKEVTVIHELLGPVAGTTEPEWISCYHQALEAYAVKDAKEARRLFTAVTDNRGEPDGPSAYFINRLNLGEWGHDGVVEMTEK